LDCNGVNDRLIQRNLVNMVNYNKGNN